MATDTAGSGFGAKLNSVFIKCAAVVALSTAIVTAFLTWQTSSQLGSAVYEDVVHRGDSMTRLLAQQIQGAVRFGKADTVAADLDRFIAESDGLATAAVAVDATGEVLATGGRPAEDLAGRAAEVAKTGEAIMSRDDLVVVYPVTIGPAEDLAGAVAIAWTVEPKTAALAQQRRTTIAISAAVFLVVLAAGIVYLRWSISKPLVRIGAAMRQVADEDFGVVVPSLDRGDEIGAIARDLEGFRARLSDAADQAREAAYKSAGFEGSSAALLMTDRDGRIRFANPAFGTLLPSLAEMTEVPLGAAVTELAPELGDLQTLLDAPSRLPVARDIRRNDTYLAITVNAVRDSGGELIGAIVEWKDATAEYLNAAVIDSINANQVRAAFDPAGRLVDANDNFRRIALPAGAGIDGLKIADLIRDDALVSAFRSGKGPEAARFDRFRVAAADGSVAIVDGGFTPVTDASGQPMQFVLIGTDITEDEAQLAKAESARKQLAEAQQKVVEALRAGLARLSEGDLTHEITEAFDAQYETLRSDFNAAVRGLHDAVADVIELALSMRAEVTEIASAADDLSRRTEHQAATLEETAAALAEITAAVASAAEGARKADEVVVEARGAAEESGAVVKDTVAAMGEIASSSDRISKIIGVIDDIAFQTNLLALNAGVEAARAGDAGRGFAVVASEVRALAQRSSEAAREINELITTSGGHVQQGVSLVGRTGEALEAISSSVKNISENVAEIVVSSQEQSTGLTEVNNSMGQLDQVTQQNAAMFEETSAASQQLVRQADALSDRVSQFRIRAATSGAASRTTVSPARPAAADPKAGEASGRDAAHPRAAAAPQSAGNLALSVQADDDWEDF